MRIIAARIVLLRAVGSDTFVTFDKKAARLLTAQGRAAKVLA